MKPTQDDDRVAGEKVFSQKQREEQPRALKTRFEENLNRHKGVEWAKVQAKLEAGAEKLWSLLELDRTGGEPDVVGHDKGTGEHGLCDSSPVSPKGRTSVCCDREGLESRTEHRPRASALDMAAAVGIELLTEEQNLELRKLGEFDTKTSSRVETPPKSENSAADSIVTAATAASSWVKTVRSLTTAPGRSVARKGFKHVAKPENGSIHRG